jgi:hypothetical protein
MAGHSHVGCIHEPCGALVLHLGRRRAAGQVFREG